MRTVYVLLILMSFHFYSQAQICELVPGGEVNIEFLNLTISNITDNGQDCNLDYSLDYRVNNPNGCQVNFQALVRTDDGSQTNFNVETDGAWHTEIGTIFNGQCTGVTKISITGGWGFPCSQQQVSFPGIDCESIPYSNSNLPVELVSFDAELYGSHIDLNWETAFETNNKYFIVEHSIDNIIFTELEVIDGIESTTNQKYHYTHREPVVGTNYYRLQQVDNDGAYEYSKTIVVEMEEEAEIEVFPNPTHGNLKIRLPNNQSASFKIYNTSGQEMHLEMRIETDYELSMDDLPSGLYIIRFLTNQGVVVHRIYKM